MQRIFQHLSPVRSDRLSNRATDHSIAQQCETGSGVSSQRPQKNASRWVLAEFRTEKHVRYLSTDFRDSTSLITELKDTVSHVGQRLVDTVKNTWNMMYHLAVNKSVDAAESVIQQELSQVRMPQGTVGYLKEFRDCEYRIFEGTGARALGAWNSKSGVFPKFSRLAEPDVKNLKDSIQFYTCPISRSCKAAKRYAKNRSTRISYLLSR